MTKDTDLKNGVITTQNISTVIRPKGNDNSLQFVKIQTPELSKKAAEQIKIAQEINKNSKEKIKEVEEEWQNNLLNWKSKRRQQFGHSVDYEPNNNHSFDSSNDQCNGQRRIKTFAEMLEQRAKSGDRRLSYHLQRYIGAEDEDDDDQGQQGLEELDKRECADDGRDVGRGHNSSAYQHCQDIDSNNKDHHYNNNNNNNNNHHHHHHHLDEDGPAHLKNKTESSDIDSTGTTATTSTSSTTSNNRMMMMNREPEVMEDEQIRNKGEVEYDDSNGVCDDEDDDEYEEEDLEEEEQKRSQRIAFEAKLRAFEKLTIPTSSQVSKFPPINRSVVQQQQLQMQPSLPSPLELRTLPQPAPVLRAPPQPPAELRAPPQLPLELRAPPQPSLELRAPIQPSQELRAPTQPPPELRAPLQVPPPPIQKHRNVPANQQRKPVRDDKEGTVLSVSGKKRCSSCKEELGRGAAAFVVESLSLVYHTNCFRCSVCHVNLSNGFRGVDVRVHAGALHCQNCYSKDGLNYSRV